MSERLALWALATFHVVAFVVAALLLQFAGGGIAGVLAGLNTSAGFAAFVALWLTTRYTTTRAFAGRISEASTGLLRLALRWGAVNGWLFLVLLLFGAAVTIPLSTPAGASPFFLLPFGVIATPFALIIGAAIGLFFGFVDLVLLEIARALARRCAA
jgi:hypothetical protein